VQNSKLKFDRDSARTRLAAGHDNLVMPVARTEIRKNSFVVDLGVWVGPNRTEDVRT
jgi:hypothetical protein